MEKLIEITGGFQPECYSHITGVVVPAHLIFCFRSDFVESLSTYPARSSGSILRSSGHPLSDRSCAAAPSQTARLKTFSYRRRHTKPRMQEHFGGTDVKRSHWGWMLFCILSASLPLFSQTATTSLRGTIKDPSGALVADAKITLSDNANGQTFTAITNSAGLYAFPQ